MHRRCKCSKEWRRKQLLAKEAQIQETNARKHKRKQDAKTAAQERQKARDQRFKVCERNTNLGGKSSGFLTFML